jgi:RHS repeat-associated protein
VTDASGAEVTSKFTGQEWDAETGLYYYGARYYQPALGRFLSADSIVPSATDSQAFNRYAYARDNPITYTDPTGHSFWSVIGGIFGSIAGALFSVLAAIARAVTWAVNLYVDAVKFIIKGQIFALQIAKGMLIAATRNPMAALSIILAVAAGPPGWVGLAVSIAAQGMAMAAGIRDPQTLGLIGAVAGATTIAAMLIGAAKYGAGQLAGEAVKGGGGPPWLAMVASMATTMVVNEATSDPEPSADTGGPHMSEEGIEFVKQREEFRAQVYNDEAGKPTIGYGHKLLPGETFPNGISEVDAMALLKQDIDKIVPKSGEGHCSPVAEPG